MANNFKNPETGEVVTIEHAWLWSLLFGAFYFMYKEAWKLTAITFLLALFTGGFSWFIVPFFAKHALEKHYISLGYEATEETVTSKLSKVTNIPSGNNLSKIEKLGELKEKGYITEEEFQEQKKKLLK